MISENKNCQNCKSEFQIEPEDFEFYAKIKVPAPTFCPECRAQRRIVWRNERSLYKRKDAFGNDVVSIYSPDKPFIVYQRDYWWSDAWDPMQYGRDYVFSKSFFQQFRELLEAVPVSSVFASNVVNSPYVNHVGGLKNSYLTFASWEGENLFYCDKVGYSKDSFDSYLVDRSELCYWDIDCENSYRLFFSAQCSSCTDSYFLFDCKNCQNCFGSVGLRNKQYYIFNKPYSKDEYETKLKEINIGSFQNFQKYLDLCSKHRLLYPSRFARLINSPGTVGDNCRNTKNCIQCFDMRENVEDSKYMVQGGYGMKDSYDGYGVGICELLYEAVDAGVDGGVREKFCVVVYGSSDVDYCFNCEGSSNLFGCIGLRKKQYCIFNKQYTKEEYFLLREKIIDQMNSLPYVDSGGRTYRYGEFFPAEVSPFAYNETIAQEYFPLSKEEAIDRGYVYKDPEAKKYSIDIKAKDLPDLIQDTDDTILEKMIGCEHDGLCKEQCSTAYRIIPQELDFYRKMNLPIPRLCPNCRRYQRLKQRNPLKLWSRKCQCAGPKSENILYSNTAEHFHKADHCPNEFETSYAPDRSEIVYCEECYQKEVS